MRQKYLKVTLTANVLQIGMLCSFSFHGALQVAVFYM